MPLQGWITTLLNELHALLQSAEKTGFLRAMKIDRIDLCIKGALTEAQLAEIKSALTEGTIPHQIDIFFSIILLKIQLF